MSFLVGFQHKKGKGGEGGGAGIHPKRTFVAEMAILAKKFAEKVRES